jgi:hypothetical protein
VACVRASRTVRVAAGVFVVGAIAVAPYLYDHYFRVLPHPPPARIASGANCLAPNILRQLVPVPVPALDPADDAPEAGALPPDFHPIAVVTCTEATTEDDAVNGIATVDEEHWTGDLSAVLMAFAQPSRPQSWFSDCTASAARLPAVWLVDAADRAVRPAFPHEAECGVSSHTPISAIRRLEQTKTVQHILPTSP